jgi:hypothetical protein
MVCLRCSIEIAVTPEILNIFVKIHDSHFNSIRFSRYIIDVVDVESQGLGVGLDQAMVDPNSTLLVLKFVDLSLRV